MCDHCCSGMVINIAYCECVFVALGIQHEMRMLHIVNLWPARLYDIFPHYLIKYTILEEKSQIVKYVL